MHAITPPVSCDYWLAAATLRVFKKGARQATRSPRTESVPDAKLAKRNLITLASGQRVKAVARMRPDHMLSNSRDIFLFASLNSRYSLPREIQNGLDHPVLLFFGDLRKHRQREEFDGHSFSNRKGSLFIA